MNQTVYKHLMQTYGRRPGVWAGVVAGFLRPFILMTLTGLVTSQLVAAVAAGDMAGAQQFVWYLLILNLLGVVVTTLGELIAVNAENNQYEKLIIAYHQKLAGKDMSFYRDHQTGYLTSLFRQYLDSSMMLVRSLRSEVMRVFVALVAPVVVLGFVDWRLGLAALGIILVQFVYIAWASARANIYRERSHEIYRRVTGEVADEVTNIVAFKSSGQEEKGFSKVARLAREEIKTFWLRRKVTTLLDVPRGIITSVATAGAFFLVLTISPPGAETVGLLVLVLSYMMTMIRNVNELPTVMTHHDDLVTKLYPTLEYLGHNHEQIRDPEKPRKLKINKGAIGIQHVNFSYPSHIESGQEIPVFKDLTIEIKGGEHVGIVGLSGAGKSTLASLLMRFDDVKGGAITIDNVDIRSVRQSELRRNIAYVPQEPLLFHRSIRENITYFNPGATETQLLRAAKAAHAHEFIEKLPAKYETIVGERGVKLSGGQKQRVVIARSILKNAPIMIFDEATSALDSESEKIIQQALPEIIGKHTAIVIAHRLSTIAAMDRILVMHAGEVIEEGTHEQLLKRKGRYYSLWQKQTAER